MFGARLCLIWLVKCLGPVRCNHPTFRENTMTASDHKPAADFLDLLLSLAMLAVLTLLMTPAG